MLIKIRAHRCEFFNKKADRWADEGREDVDNLRWDGPSSHPNELMRELNTDAP